MAKCKNEMAEMIVHQAMEESPGELSSNNPMVLSCGGIYIPYEKRSKMKRPLWEVLNVANEKRPTKVVSSSLPKSPLAMMLDKENMN